MARNPIRPLTADETRAAVAAARDLRPYVGTGLVVHVDYTKRDGSRRTLSGTVVEMGGHDSSAHVKIQTEEGMRSANLYGIHSVSNGM